jgi:hypothetical protein
MALFTQFVASNNVSFGTKKPYCSSVVPIRAITFNPGGIEVDVAEGIRDVGLETCVGVSVEGSGVLIGAEKSAGF